MNHDTIPFMKKRIVIQFCVTAKEKRAIRLAAKRQKQTMSAFILNATCERANVLRRWESDPRV